MTVRQLGNKNPAGHHGDRSFCRALSDKMSTKGVTNGVSSVRCLPNRDSALLEIILEFRDADDFEVEDRSRKQDSGSCLDSIIEVLKLSGTA